MKTGMGLAMLGPGRQHIGIIMTILIGTVAAALLAQCGVVRASARYSPRSSPL